MAVSRKGIPDGSRRLVPRKASARSRVSNGADILPDVDGRSAVARRYRDITAQIIADMGGASQCAEARLQLIRRFAAAAVLAEQMEARLANGHSINITDHALLSSTLVRLAQRTTLAEKVSHCGVAKLRFLVAVAFQTSPAQAITNPHRTGIPMPHNARL